MCKLIKIPDFGIQNFVTYKDRENLDFRPSSTDKK